jgi:hypothetical protein
MSTELATKAVSTAYGYLLQAMLAGGTTADKLSGFRVEEIKLDQTNKNFHIVLGYDVQGSLPFEKKREYKQFLVSSTGDAVLEMTKWKE